MVHGEAKVNHLLAVRNLEAKILEHLQILNVEPCVETKSYIVVSWIPPPPNVVKMNVDAALVGTEATLAAVARDSSRTIFNCWTKRLPTFDPCIVEATAILWSLELAQVIGLPNVEVEGDAKICFEAIMVENAETPWRILSIISNVKLLALKFSSCSFCWVRGDANDVAYSLAKCASSQPLSVSYNSTNLPFSIHEAWLRFASFGLI